MCGKNERLEQRVDQYREQMELQRQSYSSQQDQSSDYRQILRKKDKEMNAVLDQIEVCILCDDHVRITVHMQHHAAVASFEGLKLLKAYQSLESKLLFGSFITMVTFQLPTCWFPIAYGYTVSRILDKF